MAAGRGADHHGPRTYRGDSFYSDVACLEEAVVEAVVERPKPCEGHYLKNGDFVCDSGRRIKGPLCKSCAGLVNQGKCLACGAK